MTDHDAGYVQALMDMQMAIRRMVNDIDASSKDKVELLGVVSFLDTMITMMMKLEPAGDHDERDAPNPLSGSV